MALDATTIEGPRAAACVRFGREDMVDEHVENLVSAVMAYAGVKPVRAPECGPVGAA